MIISKEPIRLKSTQLKMLKSGWGSSSIENSEVFDISYSSDNLKVNGFLAHPVDTNKKYPCIIWCRGGIGNSGAIDSFTARGLFGQLASWGYVVFSTQYKGNAGSEGTDEFRGSDVNDILNLVDLANEFSFADTSNWGIEGWSRGGMMTYLTLTKTDLFKCAIITGGIADVSCESKQNNYLKNLYEKSILSDSVKPFEEICNSRSIIKFPEKLSKSTPILLLHGANDDRVSPNDSLIMGQNFHKLGIPFQLKIYNEGDHFLKNFKTDVDKERKTWFHKYLKNNSEEI